MIRKEILVNMKMHYSLWEINFVGLLLVFSKPLDAATAYLA